MFYHPERDLSLVVHGDDFTFCGLEEDLHWIKDLMGSWFEIKVRGVLGSDEGDVGQIVLLGRVITWTEKGIEYEADPRHRKLVLDYFGLGEGSEETLTVNGEKEEEVQPGDEVELGPQEATEFRGVAARVNYVSLDCPDLQFPVKQCSREMANPNKRSWTKLKRVARYMLGIRSVKWVYKWQEEPEHCDTTADSDWGGKY